MARLRSARSGRRKHNARVALERRGIDGVPRSLNTWLVPVGYFCNVADIDLNVGSGGHAEISAKRGVNNQMVGMRSFTKEYVDSCRAKVKKDVASFKKYAAPEPLETTFFNNMVIVLDRMFVHRFRAVEGKDGNPLNEVRLLCDSMTGSNNQLQMDNTIKYDPDGSVLKLRVGDEIRLNEADFARLSSAFFAEMELKFLVDEAVSQAA
jgi:hypothetical protein